MCLEANVKDKGIVQDVKVKALYMHFANLTDPVVPVRLEPLVIVGRRLRFGDVKRLVARVVVDRVSRCQLICAYSQT